MRDLLSLAFEARVGLRFHDAIPRSPWCCMGVVLGRDHRGVYLQQVRCCWRLQGERCGPCRCWAARLDPLALPGCRCVCWQMLQAHQPELMLKLMLRAACLLLQVAPRALMDVHTLFTEVWFDTRAPLLVVSRTALGGAALSAVGCS